MIKILTSRKLEYYLIAIVIVAIGLTLPNIPFRNVPLVIFGAVLFLLYLTRIFIAFRHWKFSKGISFIDAFLNLQILISVEAITYTFLNWPGHYVLTFEAVTGTQMFILIIGIYLLVKRKKINRTVYWEYLKDDTIKALIGMMICIVLYYAFHMSEHINPLILKGGVGFTLP